MLPVSSQTYADILKADLCAFIQRSFVELNPAAPFEYNWHIEVLAAKLVDVKVGKCRRLIINIPPRFLKSHSVTVAFVAWLLGHEPTKKILAVSCTQDLSEKLARDCRTLIESPLYRSVFDTKLSSERNTVADFETTQGGYRLSTSVGGAITGRGADLLIMDDYIKADDALSEARRRAANAWFDNSARSRLNNQEKGAIIIVMQRLHADDLVAHVTEHEEWDMLSFPAIAERCETYRINTPYGVRQIERVTGDVLQPSRLTMSTLKSLRDTMNEYNFAAQYQQDPQPPAGMLIKREYLRFYTPVEKPERFEKIIQSWDTANKATELSDFSVCTTWGLHEKRMYLLDVYRRRVEFPELKKTFLDLAALWQADIVLVEDKASGQQLIQDMQMARFYKIQAAPKLDGDKVMKLASQAPMIEGGFALFPEKAPWLSSYLLELTTFPSSKNDDQVDSTVYAMAWAKEKACKPPGFFSLDWG